MTTIIQTIKNIEKEISALKKAIAEKESLLPGLRLAAKLEGADDEEKEEAEDNPLAGMRLRMADVPLKVLELLEDEGDDVPYSAILKIVDNTRDGRYALRNLEDRGFAKGDEKNDTARVTPLGREFIKQYRGKR